MFDSEPEDELNGKAFVRQDYEPCDEATRAYVIAMGNRLGVLSRVTKPTSHEKIVRCLSDLLMACRNRYGALICWSMNKADYSGPPYSHSIAKQVLEAAQRSGDLYQAHKGEKGVSARYRVQHDVPAFLQFRLHGEGAVVEVRAEKPRRNQGHVRKGKKLNLSQFRPEVTPIEQQMKEINNLLRKHPLQDADGTAGGGCRRIFNNSNLECGGRLQGGWQNVNSEKRLRMTIDGERLCEIDLKACFLFIANAVTGHTMDLSADPYSDLRFVKEVNCPDRRKTLRNAAKLFVSTYLSVEGGMTQFPKGKKTYIDRSGVKKTISFKEEFGLHKTVKCSDWIRDLHDAFPFLRNISFQKGSLMFMESQIMVTALLSLIEHDTPAYPVHDCLLCKEADRYLVVDKLQRAMIEVVGYQGYMDIEYVDGAEEFVSPDPDKLNKPKDFNNQKWYRYDWGVTEDDIRIIEDY